MRLNYIDNVDCLEGLRDVPDGSVDLVLCDLPYGVTKCEWDKVIPFDEMWTQLHRVVKTKGVAVLFGQQPFMTKLISSNFGDFSHCWYWKKNTVTGFLNAHRMPMKNVEEIAVFVLNAPGKNNTGRFLELRKYFFDELEKSGKTRAELGQALGSSMASHYFTWGAQFAIPTAAAYKKLQDTTGRFVRPYEEIKAEWDGGTATAAAGRAKPVPFTFNPQGTKAVNITKIETGQAGMYAGALPKEYKQTATGYPRQLLEFDTPNSKDRLHPTQKPLALCEYLIRTYSNTGETVLDMCMGPGTTAVACIRTGRNYIGFELDPQYHATALARVAAEPMGTGEDWMQ